MSAALHSYRLLVLLGLSVLVVSGLGAGWLLSQQGAVPVAVPTPLAAAEPPRNDTVVCFGQVDLERGCTPLTPVVPGRVVEVCVAEGDTVQAGQWLLRLDDEQAKARVAEAEAALQGTEALLTKAQAMAKLQDGALRMQQDAVNVASSRLTQARLLVEQKQDMHKSNLISSREIAFAEAGVQEAESLAAVERTRLDQLKQQDLQSDVQRAEAEVAAARARLRQAQLAVEECRLKAPRRHHRPFADDRWRRAGHSWQGPRPDLRRG